MDDLVSLSIFIPSPPTQKDTCMLGKILQFHFHGINRSVATLTFTVNSFGVLGLCNILFCI